MKYFAHIHTSEHDSGSPEVLVFNEDDQLTARYPLSDEDTLRSALDKLWYDHGWRVLSDPAREYTAVEVGYDIIEVEPM